MSILSVATIQSSNSTSDLTLKASNNSGAEIVLYANGALSLPTLPTANITTLQITNIVAGGNSGSAGQVLVSNGTAVSWTNAPSSPSFNTAISNQIGFLATTDLTAAFTAPSTANQRYIIHSIHATNIGIGVNDVYLELEGTQYANNALAGNIPLPASASLEFLKRPKILYPNDKLKVKTTANNSIHIMIVYEVSTDINLFGGGYNIATGNTTYDAFVATGNSVIESIQLINYNSNTSALPIDVNVQTIWVDAANNVQGYFTYDLLVPSKSTIDVLGAPKVLPSGHKIQVRASQTDYADIIIAGKLI